MRVCFERAAERGQRKRLMVKATRGRKGIAVCISSDSQTAALAAPGVTTPASFGFFRHERASDSLVPE